MQICQENEEGRRTIQTIRELRPSSRKRNGKTIRNTTEQWSSEVLAFLRKEKYV